MASNRLGIIGSSGGSALAAADECMRHAGRKVEWVVITDRECGLEKWAASEALEAHRLDYVDATDFSRRALRIFQEAGCDSVLLFYTRRVAVPLIDRLKVWNIHPALLPAFVGFNAVDQAIAGGVKIFGATLHRVDEGLDTGPVVAQIASGLSTGRSHEQIQRLSFFHKVWLTLCWLDDLTGGCSQKTQNVMFGEDAALAYPGIRDDALLASYLAWARLQISKEDSAG